MNRTLAEYREYILNEWFIEIMHFYLPAYLSTFVLTEEWAFLNDINDLFYKSHSINGLEHVTNLVHHKRDTHEDMRFYM